MKKYKIDISFEDKTTATFLVYGESVEEAQNEIYLLITAINSGSSSYEEPIFDKIQSEVKSGTWTDEEVYQYDDFIYSED